MRRKAPDDLDSVMDSVNEWEKRQRGNEESFTSNPSSNKIFLGTVDQFFSRINVAAVKLESELKVGDIIEIGDEEEAIRQKVSSMQIDRKDVGKASEGDDVGLKLKYSVSTGSKVYKIER